jgi:hypothetical protein
LSGLAFLLSDCVTRPRRSRAIEKGFQLWGSAIDADIGLEGLRC